MSQWTHVAGIIRIDDIRFHPQTDQQIIEKLNLGNTCNYEDDQIVWDKCDVPRGSEGSLSYQVNINPHANAVAAYVVTVWGDLRDYDNADEIIAYFKRIIAGKMIRACSFQIEIEYQTIRHFITVQNDEGFESTLCEIIEGKAVPV